MLLVVTMTRSVAQAIESDPGVSNIFKLNFFLPGLSYEQRLAQYQTLYTSAFLDFNTASSSVNGVNQFEILLAPSVNVSMRYYYNINKRTRKGKDTALNSANYLAPIYIGRYAFANRNEDRRWINQAGVVWGIQRNSRQGFSLDLNLGLSFIFNMEHADYYSPVSAITQLSLGYWIGRKQATDL
jgi:hypothetical protein